MTYDKDSGPLDYAGNVIKPGQRIVVGSNSGLRFGVVEYVVVHYNDFRNRYNYTIRVMKDTGKRQSFDHEHMGEAKFGILDLTAPIE